MYQSKQQYQTDVNLRINTNGQGQITGAILNEILINQSDSVMWGIAQQANAVAISDTPQIITFAVSMPSTQYALMIRCYDAQGDPVDYRITGVLTTSFTITGAVAGGIIDWRATHG